MSLQNLDRPHPVDGTDAKFSTQYVVARALADGWLRLEHFEDAALTEPRITELLDKTDVRPHPEIKADDPEIFACEVAIIDRQGRRHAKFSRVREQRGFANPLSEPELKQKFLDCALRTVSAARAETIYGALQSMDSHWRFGNLLGALSSLEPAEAAE
jgi:2-methylcitrate dehydratase PrpD